MQQQLNSDDLLAAIEGLCEFYNCPETKPQMDPSHEHGGYFVHLKVTKHFRGASVYLGESTSLICARGATLRKALERLHDAFVAAAPSYEILKGPDMSILTRKLTEHELFTVENEATPVADEAFSQIFSVDRGELEVHDAFSAALVEDQAVEGGESEDDDVPPKPMRLTPAIVALMATYGGTIGTLIYFAGGWTMSLYVYRITVDKYPTEDGKPFDRQHPQLWMDIVDAHANNGDTPDWVPPHLEEWVYLWSDDPYASADEGPRIGKTVYDNDNRPMLKVPILRRRHWMSRLTAVGIVQGLRDWGCEVRLERCLLENWEEVR